MPSNETVMLKIDNIVVTQPHAVSEPAAWGNIYGICIGSSVRIKKESQYYGQGKGREPGVVIETEGKGWVRVKFKDGNTNDYRVGARGMPLDLELA
jgi:hypothetical protein